MKIKVFHKECGRDVLVQQILQTQGHCPWDGLPFNSDYTAILAEALETAENAGNVLENALEKISDMEPAMTFDRESLIAPLEAHLDRLKDNRKKQRRGIFR
ncbi:MAG TPA: hypothetical protein VHI54_03910 [Actinomycetota bacterium]|nr:hypothetical protein [Actinomycetota bacterium]